jgi:hypothetical protein
MRVLACGVPVVGAADGTAVLPYDHRDEEEDGDRLAVLAGTLRPHLDAGETVVALWPDQDGEELHRHLQAVRAALDTSRLVLHPSPLPPLAVAVLAWSLAELAAAPGTEAHRTGHGPVPDSVLASGVARLEQLICGAAWLGSVAKLRHPAPSVALHARSWLPSAAFGAAVSVDHTELTRLRGEAVLPLPSLTPAADWRVVVSDHGGDAGTVGRSLTARAPDVERLVVPPSPAGATWWGTDKLVEVAVAPRGPVRLRRALFGDRTPNECAWCGEDVLDDPCSLCGARADTGPLASGARPDPTPLASGARPDPTPLASGAPADGPLAPGAPA